CQLRGQQGWRVPADEDARPGTRAATYPGQLHCTGSSPHINQPCRLGNTGGSRAPAAADSLSPHRRARGHRAGRRLARVRCVRLRQRRHFIRRWRHDPVSRIRGQRLMLMALRRHWPEYLAEAGGLGAIMLASGLVVTAVEVPLVPVLGMLPPLGRRALEALAVAGTVTAMVYSPWGRRSGAHFNP